MFPTSSSHPSLPLSPRGLFFGNKMEPVAPAPSTSGKAPAACCSGKAKKDGKAAAAATASVATPTSASAKSAAPATSSAAKKPAAAPAQAASGSKSDKKAGKKFAIPRRILGVVSAPISAVIISKLPLSK